MSFLGKIFGTGKKGEKAPTPQEAIQRLRETEEMLSKKSDFLEKKIEEELKTAKRHGTKNKRAALQALKRKKRYDNQLRQIDGTLSTIEFQREALENASTNTEVLRVMGDAAKALKSAHKNMDMDDLDDLVDTIEEQRWIGKQITEALAFGMQLDDVDEDELKRELDELEQEELDKFLVQVRNPARDRFPSVPTEIPASDRDDKTENLLEGDVDDVHNLMDDVAEQQEIANEISEAISNPVGFGEDVDEDDLMAELEELEQEELDEQLLQVGGPATDNLPSVPTEVPAAASRKSEEDDMRELEMWAS